MQAFAVPPRNIEPTSSSSASQTPILGQCYICCKEATRQCKKCKWAVCKAHRSKEGFFKTYHQCHPCCHPVKFPSQLLEELAFAFAVYNTSKSASADPLSVSMQAVNQEHRQRAMDALLFTDGNAVHARQVLLNVNSCTSGDPHAPNRGAPSYNQTSKPPPYHQDAENIPPKKQKEDQKHQAHANAKKNFLPQPHAFGVGGEKNVPHNPSSLSMGRAPSIPIEEIQRHSENTSPEDSWHHHQHYDKKMPPKGQNPEPQRKYMAPMAVNMVSPSVMNGNGCKKPEATNVRCCPSVSIGIPPPPMVIFPGEQQLVNVNETNDDGQKTPSIKGLKEEAEINEDDFEEVLAETPLAKASTEEVAPSPKPVLNSSNGVVLRPPTALPPPPPPPAMVGGKLQAPICTPPPTKGGLPPPPPPPLLGLSSPPPPAFVALADATPTTLQKTKSIYWQKVDVITEGSIWESADTPPDQAALQQPQFYDCGSLIDEEAKTQLEEVFAKNQKTLMKPAITVPLCDGAATNLISPTGETSLLHDRKGGSIIPSGAAVIGSQRDRNIAIVLQFLRLSIEEIERRVTGYEQYTDDVFTEDQIRSLLTICPTPDESEAIRNYQRKNPHCCEMSRHALQFSSFSSGLRYFVMVIYHEPLYRMALQCWEFMLTCEAAYVDLQERTKTMAQSITALKSSKHFPQLLRYILAVGNYLNQGTNIRNVSGFKISELKKLSQVKSSANGCSSPSSASRSSTSTGMGNSSTPSQTLLEFIVESASKKFPHYHQFLEELKPCLRGYSIDIQCLSRDMSNIENGFKKCETFLTKVAKHQATTSKKNVGENSQQRGADAQGEEKTATLGVGLFQGAVKSLGGFVKSQNMLITKLGKEVSTVVDQAVSLAPYFGERMAGFSPHLLLEDVANFHKEYSAVLQKQQKEQQSVQKK